MRVKDALKARFEYMMSDITTIDDYPTIPFSNNVDPKIYIGEKNNSGWIAWKPLEKDVIHDFSDIEAELGVNIHESIKEYFNSYWFMELYTPFGKYNFNMTHVPPNEEFKHVLRNWENAKTYFGTDNLHLTLGRHHQRKTHDLIINNKTGQVATFDHDTEKLKIICNDLGDFLYSPLKKL